jgi:hypothetical protein
MGKNIYVVITILLYAGLSYIINRFSNRAISLWLFLLCFISYIATTALYIFYLLRIGNFIEGLGINIDFGHAYILVFLLAVLCIFVFFINAFFMIRGWVKRKFNTDN